MSHQVSSKKNYNKSLYTIFSNLCRIIIATGLFGVVIWFFFNLNFYIFPKFIYYKENYFIIPFYNEIFECFPEVKLSFIIYFYISGLGSNYFPWVKPYYSRASFIIVYEYKCFFSF